MSGGGLVRRSLGAGGSECAVPGDARRAGQTRAGGDRETKDSSIPPPDCYFCNLKSATERECEESFWQARLAHRAVGDVCAKARGRCTTSQAGYLGVFATVTVIPTVIAP